MQAARAIMSIPQSPGAAAPSFLLVGPYDPHGGEYTFLSPPLGVWRLAGVLESEGFAGEVFDPNICDEAPEQELTRVLRSRRWDVVGFSTTGMTLRFDLALAHLTRRVAPEAIVIAGGMEATFNPEQVLRLGAFDLVVLGEGEKPLLELGRRVAAGRAALTNLPGTAWLDESGRLHELKLAALTRDELSAAIAKTPYEKMPYRRYWERLEQSYRVKELPFKADREARLAEIRSIRLITLNYCPMACSFCSSTNFLHAAQGSTARIARLDADEIIVMLERITALYPDVRTIIFQDDIFVFTTDARVLPLCEAIVRAKEEGRLPRGLQFISTNRIDAMTDERLAAMRRAGFRVLGFGIENFSLAVLTEFNKARIHPYIERVLDTALAEGITPFLDMIMTSPRCTVADLAENVRQAYRWTTAGCEVGMYPYIIPFSGAVMSDDPTLRPYTINARRDVAGTEVSWEQPVKILPVDPIVRAAILAIESDFEARLPLIEQHVAHLPSRLRSLLWVLASIPVLSALGCEVPDREAVVTDFVARMPAVSDEERNDLRALLASAPAFVPPQAVPERRIATGT